jgi:hypothetical protein
MLTPVLFQERIGQAIEHHEHSYSGSLEEYLRSLLALVLNNASSMPSHESIAHFIADAFTTTPIPFDVAWLEYGQPVPINYNALDYLPTADKVDTRMSPRDRISNDFTTLKHILLFQIADLYRMGTSRGKPLWQYRDDRSPTDNSWYNFDVFAYLECAIAGMTSHVPKGYLNTPFTQCDWLVLAELLEFGRLYE